MQLSVSVLQVRHNLEVKGEVKSAEQQLTAVAASIEAAVTVSSEVLELKNFAAPDPRPHDCHLVLSQRACTEHGLLPGPATYRHAQMHLMAKVLDLSLIIIPET